jgi:hypothetical protein
MKTVSVNINLLPLFRSVHSEICLSKKKTYLPENRKKNLFPIADKYERKDNQEYWKE